MEIIAHRGASHDAPENTLAAARLAWLQGADAIECDVQLTADEALVVFHDNDLQRTAGAPFRLAEVTLDELQRYEVGAWRDPKFAGEKIPTLGQLLGQVAPGKRIYIEVKNGPEAVPVLVRALAHSQLTPSQVAIIAFDFEVVRRAKKLLARCDAYWVLERTDEWNESNFAQVLARAKDAQLDGLDLEAKWAAEAALAPQITAAKLKTCVWTVDDFALAQKLVKQGVTGLTTNRPAYLREQLELSN